ncbi:MAG TPA: hypothetical protein VKU01_27960 [Bryobacteraceae bacterium]|nr:hypothetical protein [Bryobacteraceae bacterium]
MAILFEPRFIFRLLIAVVLIYVPAANAAGQFYQQGNVLLNGSVVLSGDGNTALILATRSDPQAPNGLTKTLAVFTRANGTWSQQPNIDAGFDWTEVGPLALSADGNTIVAGTWADNRQFSRRKACGNRRFQ